MGGPEPSLRGRHTHCWFGVVNKGLQSCFSPLDWALQTHGASEIHTNPQQLLCKSIMGYLLILMQQAMIEHLLLSRHFTMSWEFQKRKQFGCRRKVDGSLWELGKASWNWYPHVQLTKCFYICYFIWFSQEKKETVQCIFSAFLWPTRGR